MNHLFFDTETTGVYKFNSTPDDPSQPHLVQLGAVLHDEDRRVRGALNLIIKPDGWEIPAEAAAVHGITTEHALKYGVPLELALLLFCELVERTDIVVAHNIGFDDMVMATQFHRTQQTNLMACKEKYCTMLNSTNIVRIPGRRGGYKWPSLAEAHQHFTGEGFEGAHDAMADVLACARVYYHLPNARVKGGVA